ncbi:MAG TPA: 3-dehydroquinate dehydratase, partial [Clostridiales bacterium]|nr:3-dehydroquinate dehydratase [Clostridiales bacterium]
MLELIDLTKRYDVKSVPAVLDLNLKVGRGEIFGFIGPNGAGKTTTIKMITGILE